MATDRGFDVPVDTSAEPLDYTLRADPATATPPDGWGGFRGYQLINIMVPSVLLKVTDAATYKTDTSKAFLLW